MDQPSVTVIVPSTAQRSRFAEIRRCVASIRASSAHPVPIIFVVNGNRRDDEVCEWLANQSDVRFEYVERGSAPNAVLHGRTLVTTPFFSTLDDDDEYLPGGTDLKVAAMLANPRADLIVTNWLEARDGREVTVRTHLHGKGGRPLESLFYANWLHNGNVLYRASTIGVAYFADFKPYAEWTWLAYRLALDRCRIVAIEAPTFRYHFTPNSLSQTDAYADTYLPLFDAMLKRGPPKDIARLIRRKMSAAWHDDSVRALRQGQAWRALQAHVRSLFLPDGRRYLSHSRHFLTHWLGLQKS